MDDIKKQLTKISEKLETIDGRINTIDVTLAKQHVSLDEHIRRTEILESKLEPIDTHVKMVNGALKLIGGLALLASIYRYIKQ